MNTTRHHGTQRSGAGPRIEQTMRAVPLAVPALRRLACDFVAEHGADDEVQRKVALAVTEAAANVVRHAYGEDQAGPVHFGARVADGAFEVFVNDRGHGFQAGDDRGLGAGLKLIAHSTMDFRIEALDPGMSVVMRFRSDGASSLPGEDRASRASEMCVWTALDAYLADDAEGLLACLHPEIEARLLPVASGLGSVAHGPSDVLRWVRRVRSEQWSFVIRGLRTLPDGRVLAHGWAGAGRSGSSFCAVHEFVDGLMFRVRHWFSTPDELSKLGYLDER